MKDVYKKAKYEIVNVFSITKIKEGYLLVVDKGHPDDKFKCPGGGVEKKDRSLPDAMSREFYEELNVRISPKSFKEFTIINANNGNPHSKLFFLLEAPNLSFRNLEVGPELKYFKVFDRKKLENMISYKELVEDHAEAWTQYLKSLPPEY